MRSIEGDQELPIESYEVFANDDQLLKAALNRMLYSMSTRDYEHGIDNYDDVAETSGTSKSAVSQRSSKPVQKKPRRYLGVGLTKRQFLSC